MVCFCQVHDPVVRSLSVFERLCLQPFCHQKTRPGVVRETYGQPLVQSCPRVLGVLGLPTLLLARCRRNLICHRIALRLSSSFVIFFRHCVSRIRGDSNAFQDKMSSLSRAFSGKKRCEYLSVGFSSRKVIGRDDGNEG